MQQATKLNVMIPEDRRLTLTLPEDLPPGPAEVIVLVTPKQDEEKADEDRGRRPMGIDAGKGWLADDFDAPLPEEIQRALEGEPLLGQAGSRSEPPASLIGLFSDDPDAVDEMMKTVLETRRGSQVQSVEGDDEKGAP